MLLLDVTPLSLGIETLGGVMTKLIEKNTTIPTRKEQVFSTAEDNQNSVTIKVYQGERAMAADNKSLGMFELSGIAPAPRGIPQINVCFDIDANGIVTVNATDKATGKSQEISIRANGGLGDEEISEMVRAAEENAEADRQRREQVEARNSAEGLISSTQKTLRDNESKLPPDLQQEVEQAITALQEQLSGSNTEAIKDAINELLNKSMKIGEHLYQPTEEPPEQKPAA